MAARKIKSLKITARNRLVSQLSYKKTNNRLYETLSIPNALLQKALQDRMTKCLRIRTIYKYI